MKKRIIKAISGFMASVLALGTLASCSTEMKLKMMEDEERAYELFNMADANAGAVDSYKTDMKMELCFEMESYWVDAKATGTETVAGIGGDNYSEYRHMDTTFKMTKRSTTTEQMATVKTGFYDGKMFEEEIDDDENVTRRWSEVSKEEYLDYKKKQSDDLNVDLDEMKFTPDNSNVVSCVEEDGTWTAKFNELSGDALETLKAVVKPLVDMGAELEISDVIVTVEFSEDFYPVELSFEYVIEEPVADEETSEDTAAETEAESEEEKKEPKIMIFASCSDFGKIEAEEGGKDVFNEFRFKEEYKIDGLIALKDIEKQLDETATADGGKFKYTTNVDVSYKSNEQESEEWGYVTFSVDEDDKLSYNMEGSTSGFGYTISYKDKQKETKVGESSTQDKSNDVTERAFLNGLMNPAKFDLKNVSSCEVGEDGKVYTVTIAEPDVSEYESSMSSMKATVSSSSATLTFTIDGDKLVKCEYTLDLKMKVSGSYMKIHQVQTCEYLENGEEASEV